MWTAVIAEVLGTFILVLVGCGSTLYFESTVHLALSFGLSVGTAVWTIAHVSGGHINPAVTCGFLVTRKISLIRALFYIIAQVLGATLGAAVLKGLTTDNYSGNYGTPSLSHGTTDLQGCGIELVITFVLVFTVLSSVDGLRRDTGGSIPLTIGLSIAMCHLWAVSTHFTEILCQLIVMVCFKSLSYIPFHPMIKVISKSKDMQNSFSYQTSYTD